MSHVVQGPNSTAVIEGSNVTFTCVSNATSKIVWKFRRNASDTAENIFTGLNIAQSHRLTPRLNVSSEFKGGLNSSNLIVASVTLLDAGTYLCAEALSDIDEYGELVVFGKQLS